MIGGREHSSHNSIVNLLAWRVPPLPHHLPTNDKQVPIQEEKDRKAVNSKSQNSVFSTDMMPYLSTYSLHDGQQFWEYGKEQQT